MARRERPRLDPEPNAYFVSDKKGLKFVSSGCTILDCALGGGYPLGRIANIVGDKSTAKTALATEAIINFLHTYSKGAAKYCESEAAFDRDYAAAMGMPVAKVDFGDPEKPIATVEDFYHDIDQFITQQTAAHRPGIYVLDSLDALSDEAEMKRDIEEGTFGASKAKQMSTLFRKLTRRVEQSQVLLIVISQVRDNIGAMFGEKHKRSGGRALDFYASQVMYLAHMGIIDRTINKVKRATGIEIKAKVKKNKVSIPLREAHFNFMFGFGVDDIAASIDWLVSVNHIEGAGLTPHEAKQYLKDIDDLSDEDYHKDRQQFSEAVKNAWREIETTFLPKRAKYA